MTCNCEHSEHDHDPQKETNMQTADVHLKIRFDETVWDHPALWAWATLLDLDDADDVVVVSAEIE